MSAGTERCRAGYSRNLARFVMIALENVEKCWIAVPLACRARTQVEKIDIPYSASLPALGASADTLHLSTSVACPNRSPRGRTVAEGEEPESKLLRRPSA